MNIYCIGRNYVEHAHELGNAVPPQPIVFLKSGACLRGLEASPMAFAGESYHHEIELVVEVGAHVTMGSGFAPVSRIALGLDLTRRQVQADLKTQGLPWTLAKSFKGSAVLAPLITADGIDLTALSFELLVNGVSKQRGDTSLMLFPVAQIIRYLLSFNDLKKGDLIFTGTPAGVGPIRVGDHFEMRFLDKSFKARL